MSEIIRKKNYTWLILLLSFFVGSIISIATVFILWGGVSANCGTHCDLAALGVFIYSLYYASFIISICLLCGLIISLILYKKYLFFSIALISLIILFLIFHVQFFRGMPIGYNTYKLFNYQKVIQYEKLSEGYLSYANNCSTPCKLRVINIRNATLAWQEQEFNKCLQEKDCDFDIKNNCKKIADLNIRPGIHHTDQIAYDCFLRINEDKLTEELCNSLSDNAPFELNTCLNLANNNLAIEKNDYNLCIYAECKVNLAIKNSDVQKCYEFDVKELGSAGTYQKLRCFYEIDKDKIDLTLCDNLATESNNFTEYSGYSGYEIRNGCYAFAYYKKAIETNEVSYCYKIHDNVNSAFVVAYQLRRECYEKLTA